jgi:hypothetical protein
LTSWIKYGLYRPASIASLVTAGHQLIRYQKILKDYPTIKAIIIEGTGLGVPSIAQFFKDKGIKIYFVPSNIESLVSYDKTWTHKIAITKRLKEDAKFFQLSDGVFCISSEEQWLLEILGVKAYYLPYNPPKAINELIQIRIKKRLLATKDSFYLYLADFGNEPNLKGFQNFLKYQNQYLADNAVKVRVVGKSGEKLASLVQHMPNLTLEGFVEDDVLEDLLSTCRGVLLYHYPSSGFLTRIIELWFSGIPIFCNLAAMKSFIHMPGIYSFDQITASNDSNPSSHEISRYKRLISYSEAEFARQVIHG